MGLQPLKKGLSIVPHLSLFGKPYPFLESLRALNTINNEFPSNKPFNKSLKLVFKIKKYGKL